MDSEKEVNDAEQNRSRGACVILREVFLNKIGEFQSLHHAKSEMGMHPAAVRSMENMEPGAVETTLFVDGFGKKVRLLNRH